MQAVRKHFWSERLRVQSQSSAAFTPPVHVRRQYLPGWPPTLNKMSLPLPTHTHTCILHNTHSLHSLCCQNAKNWKYPDWEEEPCPREDLSLLEKRDLSWTTGNVRFSNQQHCIHMNKYRNSSSWRESAVVFVFYPPSTVFPLLWCPSSKCTQKGIPRHRCRNVDQYNGSRSTTLAKKIETTARTWHRRVICRACTRLYVWLACLSQFFGQGSNFECFDVYLHVIHQEDHFQMSCDSWRRQYTVNPEYFVCILFSYISRAAACIRKSKCVPKVQSKSENPQWQWLYRNPMRTKGRSSTAYGI